MTDQPPHGSGDIPHDQTIDFVIIPRTHDIGGFEVGRALPSRQKRMVGPFVFWDQMGPGEFITGQGVDVRPHPHIGLSTLTYLFDGEMLHRDSLGIVQTIRAGDVNLMTAGSGIVHSERTPIAMRAHPHRLFGIQAWLALPMTHEHNAPFFTHIGKTDFPQIDAAGINVRLIAGSMFGKTGSLSFPHDTLYADIKLQAGRKIELPRDVEERALYALSGRLQVGNTVYDPMQLLILKPGMDVSICAETDTHVMLLGGAVMDAPRQIWWNFVSSSKEAIEDAKHRWKNGLFDMVPDEPDFIPLPE